ncbi:MAG: hypothetical protein ABI685_13085 [Ferruginibacter sp.]
MKTFILNMLLLLGITVTAAAQAYDPVPMANTPSTQPENNNLLFNPSQNVYYTEMYRSYWVWDRTSSTWVKRVELVAPYPPVTNTATRYNQTYESNAGRNNAGTIIITKPGGQ